MSTPTKEQIEKLPKHIQAYIANLERERLVAIKTLNEYCDAQTVSAISYSDLVCTGEECGPSEKTKYVQSEKIRVLCGGVELNVYTEKGRITLQWSSARRLASDVAFVPESYQRARLVAKEYMR